MGLEWKAVSKQVRHALLELVLAAAVALVVGTATAFFLCALDAVTRWHWGHPGLLWGLPIAGLLVGLLYHYLGKGSERGNNLLIDEIHQPGGGVPTRMAPLVLVGTLVTHLFGGSAGREGTAVQMGGSLASGLAKNVASERGKPPSNADVWGGGRIWRGVWHAPDGGDFCDGGANHRAPAIRCAAAGIVGECGRGCGVCSVGGGSHGLSSGGVP
jgi:hypothetical protein